MPQQKTIIKIPSTYKPSERLAIGAEIIDYIIDRTKSGKDKNNKPFPGYSKEYVKSLEFKIAGKSKGNVNLTLSGEMLESMKVLNHRSGEIIIGFDKDDENNGKAEGNIKGTYGSTTPKPGKKRDFLGIDKDDLKDKILSQFPEKDKEARRDRVERFIESEDQSKFISERFQEILKRS